MNRISSEGIAAVVASQKAARERRAVKQVAQTVSSPERDVFDRPMTGWGDDPYDDPHSGPVHDGYIFGYGDDYLDERNACDSCGAFPIHLVGDPVPYCDQCGTDLDGNAVIPDSE